MFPIKLLEKYLGCYRYLRYIELYLILLSLISCNEFVLNKDNLKVPNEKISDFTFVRLLQILMKN